MYIPSDHYRQNAPGSNPGIGLTGLESFIVLSRTQSPNKKGDCHMLARFARVLRSFLEAAGIAASPLKALTGIIVSIIVPYLLYAFLGGFGLALAVGGIIWAVWYFTKKK